MKKVHLQKYKDIYYAYVPKGQLFEPDRWVISDTPDMSGNVMWFSAKKFRIDQCIDEFREKHPRTRLWIR